MRPPDSIASGVDPISQQQAVQRLGQADALRMQGWYGRALSVYREERARCRRIGFVEGLERALLGELELLLAQSRFADVVALLGEAAGRVSPGARLRSQVVMAEKAVRLLREGRYDDALSILKAEEVIARMDGNLDALRNCLCNQGVVYLNKRQPESALERLSQMEPLCQGPGQEKALQACLGNRAVAERLRGNLAAAFELHSREERICRELGLEQDLVRCWINRAATLAKQGRLAQAFSDIQKARQRANELGATALEQEVEQRENEIRTTFLAQ